MTAPKRSWSIAPFTGPVTEAETTSRPARAAAINCHARCAAAQTRRKTAGKIETPPVVLMRTFSYQLTSNRQKPRRTGPRSPRPPRRRGQGHPRLRLPPGIAKSRCRSSVIKAIPLPRAPVIKPERPSSHSRLIAMGRFWPAASFAPQELRRLIRKRSTRCGARSHSRRHPRTCPEKPSNSQCPFVSTFGKSQGEASLEILQ